MTRLLTLLDHLPRAEIEQRHDAGTVRAWFEEGAAHDARWALDHAIGAPP